MKPSIPAEVDPGKKVLETQRKEPPVPVAPASEPKANRKFSISKVQVEVNKKKKGVLNTEKVINAPEIKPNENISKDAIEKEEREIMEVEKQKKAENDQKERELLKVLKEHQDEQKKLLREQEKILIEMKNREIKNEKKLNEILKEKAISDYAVPNKKTIKLKALKSNNKSNIVEKSKFLALRHLKERQGGNAFNVEIKAESVPNSSLLLQSVVGKDKGVDVANNTNSLPLSSAGAKKINSSILKLDFTDTKSDRKVGRRDILNDQILEGNRNREKRNINKETLNIKVSLPPSETEKCLKNNENIISADLSTKNKIDVNRISYIDNRIPEKISSVIASQKPSELIKDSKHLSVDVTNEKKSLEANVEGSKLIDSILGQSVIEKESDLKSVVSFDN